MPDETLPTPAPAGSPDPASQPAPAAAPPAAPPPTPEGTPVKPEGLWKRVLKGALTGLLQNGIPGAIGGAIDPQQAQQIRTTQMQQRAQAVTFKDAQTAATVAQITKLDQDIHDEPEKMQRERDDHGMKLVQFNRTLGQDYDAFPNTGDNAKQFMAQAAANDPDGISLQGRPIVTPSMIYVPKPTDTQTKYNRLAKLAPLFGLSVPDKNVFSQLKPAQQVSTLAQVESRIGGHDAKGDSMKADDLRKQIVVLKANLDAYKNKPEFDSAVFDQGTRTLELLQKQASEDKSIAGEKEGSQIRVATARGRANQSFKNLAVLDENNNLINVPAYVAWDKGLAPASATKQLGGAAQMEDIATASRSLRGEINKMPVDGFDPATVAQIRAALDGVQDDASFSAIRASLQSSLANKQLTTGQKSYLTWLAQMQERALSIRGAAGLGNQGSETVRRAIKNALPVEGDDRELQLKKLNAFDNMVAVVGRGIPGVGRNAQNTKIATGQTDTPADTLPPSAAAQLQEGVSHTFRNHQVWTKQNGQPKRLK